MRASVRAMIWMGVAALAVMVMAGGCGRSPSGRVASDPGVAVAAPAKAGSSADKSLGDAGPVERAIARAGKERKYAFLLFYLPGQEPSEGMLATFRKTEGKLRDKAVFLAIDRRSDAGRPLANRYGIAMLELPVTLVIAPSGTIVRGFVKPVDENTLSQAFVTPTTEVMLRKLQDGKLVILCVQGAKTEHNKESLAAAKGLAADPSLKGRAEILMLDPFKKEEAQLLKDCRLTGNVTEANVLILVPPNRLVGTVAGATTKDALMAALKRGLAACNPSSGCCPKPPAR